MALRTIAIALTLLSGAGSAFAGDATGTWLHEDGASKVHVAPCGKALCGTIVWLKESNGPAKIGQKVFYDMVPSGDNNWTGKAFEPSSGKEYTGKMTLAGDSLTTAGCVMGGLICKSIVWSRATESARRDCEERSDEVIHSKSAAPYEWIASLRSQ